MSDGWEQPSVSTVLGRALGFMGRWLEAILPIYLKIVTPTSVRVLAIQHALIRKGILTLEDIAAVEEEARAGFAVENAVGPPAQMIELALKTFRSGMLDAVIDSAPGEKGDAHG